jgi:hypothetical protein
MDTACRRGPVSWEKNSECQMLAAPVDAKISGGMTKTYEKVRHPPGIFDAMSRRRRATSTCQTEVSAVLGM